jgi:hypothetical protein
MQLIVAQKYLTLAILGEPVYGSQRNSFSAGARSYKILERSGVKWAILVLGLLTAVCKLIKTTCNFLIAFHLIKD